MQFKFEQHIIWQKAMKYDESIFRSSYVFPKEEVYNHSSQMQGAINTSDFRLRTSDFQLPTYQKLFIYNQKNK
jgi:hypothetical protein